MLGKKVDVSILGAIPYAGLYSGYIMTGTHRRGVYVLSRERPVDVVRCTVIAVTQCKGLTQSKLIVAPEGQIYYEPLIRKRLRRLHNFRFSKINCLYEKSCGAIVFYRAPEEVKVLLVKNKNGRYWSFPKGHVELGENEKQTAIREIKEETDLDVKIHPSFRETSDYCPFGKVRKRVVFFLAEAFTDKVHIQESEIDYYIWVNFRQARDMCCYDNDLRVIDKAERYLGGYHSK
ncbi:MAG: NUDIX domain-containing protein [Lachnospiraceae bacterium]|nr:NUDIX domain-containing protein [Lachnospiraceae bacterium]